MSPTPTPPFWFTQRQAKAEPAGPNAYRLTAPNLGEAFISIRRAGDNGWQATLRFSADGPDVAVSERSYDRPEDAWAATFELYRIHVVV